MVSVMFDLSLKAQSCVQHPAYGDSLIGISTSYDTTGFNTGSTGAGVIWNFSGLVIDTTDVISHYYFDPSTTPGTGSFPGADLADLTPVGQYTYTKYSTDSITTLGVWSAPLNCTSQLFYDPQSLICPFPFGTVFSDDYNGYTCGSGSYSHTSGTRINTFDGTGILILPTTTYANINRIKITDTVLDSSFVSNGTFIGATSSISTNYLWVDGNTNQVAFLMLDFKSITYNMTFRFISWFNYSHIPSMITSVRSTMEDQSKIKIYPNPFNSSTTIQLKSSISNGELNILNVFGQKIKTMSNISGDQIKIERDNLSSGIYLIRLTQDNKTITSEKIIITD